MKCQINKTQIGDKQWVEVIFPGGVKWIPSFDELGTIIKMIGECEDEKYSNGQGLEMTKDFFDNAILTGMSYQEYCEWKKIPTKKTEAEEMEEFSKQSL